VLILLEEPTKFPLPFAWDTAAATSRGSLAQGQVPVLNFLHPGWSADLQPSGRVANPTGLHGHVDALLLALWRLPGIAGVQQQRAAASLSALAAALTWLALTSVAVSDDVGALAVGTG